MAMTLELLLSWDPEPLQTAADNLVTDRRTLLNLQDELDAGRPPYDWEGDDATAAEGTYESIRERINDIVAPLSGVIGSLDDAAAIIGTSKSDAQRLKEIFANNGWNLSSCGTSIVLTDPDGRTPEETLTGNAELMVSALTAADEADLDLKQTLVAAAGGFWNGGSGSMLDAALPARMDGQRLEQRFEDMSDEELVDYAIANPEEVDTYLELMSPRQRELIGEGMATELEDYTVNNADGSGTYPTQQEFDDQTELVETLGSNPEVAASMLETMGPDGYAAAQATLMRYEGTVSEGSSSRASDAWNQLLPTASSELPSSWADQVGEAGETYYVTPEGYRRGWELMGPALAQEGYDTDFIVNVGDQLLTYDEQVVQPGGVDVAWENDPVANLMQGVSHNPDASQQLLDPEANNNLDSLMDRQWTYPEDPSEQPGMSYFGDALVSATSLPNETSTQIYAQTANHYGAEETTVPWEISDDLALMSGTFMPQIYDEMGMDGGSANVVGEGTPMAPGFSDDPSSLSYLDRTELEDLLTDLGRYESSGETVTTYANAFGALAYDAYLGEATPETWNDTVNNTGSVVGSPWMSVVGAVEAGGYQQALIDSANDDDQADDVEDAAIDVGAGVVSSAVDLSKVHLVGWLLDPLASEAIEAVQTDLTESNNVNNTADVRQELDGAMNTDRESLETTMDGVMFNSMPPEMLREIDPSFVTEDGPVRWDSLNSEQQQQWSLWFVGSENAGTAGPQVALDALDDELTQQFLDRVQSESETQQQEGSEGP